MASLNNFSLPDSRLLDALQRELYDNTVQMLRTTNRHYCEPGGPSELSQRMHKTWWQYAIAHRLQPKRPREGKLIPFPVTRSADAKPVPSARQGAGEGRVSCD